MKTKIICLFATVAILVNIALPLTAYAQTPTPTPTPTPDWYVVPAFLTVVECTSDTTVTTFENTAEIETNHPRQDTNIKGCNVEFDMSNVPPEARVYKKGTESGPGIYGFKYTIEDFYTDYPSFFHAFMGNESPALDNTELVITTNTSWYTNVGDRVCYHNETAHPSAPWEDCDTETHAMGTSLPGSNDYNEFSLTTTGFTNNFPPNIVGGSIIDFDIVYFGGAPPADTCSDYSLDWTFDTDLEEWEHSILWPWTGITGNNAPGAMVYAGESGQSSTIVTAAELVEKINEEYPELEITIENITDTATITIDSFEGYSKRGPNPDTVASLEIYYVEEGQSSESQFQYEGNNDWIFEEVFFNPANTFKALAVTAYDYGPTFDDLRVNFTASCPEEPTPTPTPTGTITPTVTSTPGPSPTPLPPPPVPLPGDEGEVVCYICLRPNSVFQVWEWLRWLGCLFYNLFMCHLRIWLLTLGNWVLGVFLQVFALAIYLPEALQSWIGWAAATIGNALTWLLQIWDNVRLGALAYIRQLLVNAVPLVLETGRWLWETVESITLFIATTALDALTWLLDVWDNIRFGFTGWLRGLAGNSLLWSAAQAAVEVVDRVIQFLLLIWELIKAVWRIFVALIQAFFGLFGLMGEIIVALIDALGAEPYDIAEFIPGFGPESDLSTFLAADGVNDGKILWLVLAGVVVGDRIAGDFGLQYIQWLFIGSTAIAVFMWTLKQWQEIVTAPS